MIIPQWSAPDRVQAVSSTRRGGLSDAPYHSLNLGMHVGDLAEHVQQNRQIIRKQASMPGNPVWMNQTHSIKIASIDHSSDAVIDADGIFTETPGVVCAVMTADCLPVLLTNTEGTQVAAVHAGWRGLAGGILEACLDLFSGPVIAWLGPAIGQQAFEVGRDVVDAFVSFDRQSMTAFSQSPVSKDKWLADLTRLATQRLTQMGVISVSSCGQCTFNNPQQFFSYRRDGVTGRQASFIWIS